MASSVAHAVVRHGLPLGPYTVPAVSAWGDVGVPVLTAVVGWVGNTIVFWRGRQKEKADRKQAQADLKLAQEELAQAKREAADAKERWQEEGDRTQLDRAATLCRGNEKEATQGRAILEGMAAMGSTNPRVTELLDQMTQLELGRTVKEIATAKAAGEDPEVVQEAVPSDALSISDEVHVEITRGTAEHVGEEGGHGNEAP